MVAPAPTAASDRGSITFTNLREGWWRVTWLPPAAPAEFAEGNKVGIFDALIDWGFPPADVGAWLKELP